MTYRLIYMVKQLDDGVRRLSYPQSSRMAINPWLMATDSAALLEDPQMKSEFVSFQLYSLLHWIMCTVSESTGVRMCLFFYYVL